MKNIIENYFRYLNNELEFNDIFNDNDSIKKPIILDEFGIGIVMSLGYMAYRVYKNELSKAARICKGLDGNVKSVCLNNYKIAKLQKLISEYKAIKKKCKKIRENEKKEKCIERMDDKIEKSKDKISKIKGRIKFVKTGKFSSLGI